MDTLTFQLGFYYGTSLGYSECMAELAKIHIARMSELGDKTGITICSSTDLLCNCTYI